MSEPNYHEIDAAIAELDEQIETLQTAKRDLWKSVRDEHGKKLADQIKLAVKLNRMDGEKRVERDEIEEGAFRILSILQGHRAPRATRVRENIEQFPPHNPETGELTDTQEQPETATQSQRAGNTAKASVARVSQAEGDSEEISAPLSPSPESTQAIADDEAAQANPTSSAPNSNPQPILLPGNADSPASISSPEPGSLSEDNFDPSKLTFLTQGETKRKTAADYRGDDCRHPDGCGSTDPFGLCYQCRKAMEAASETEAAA